MNGPGDPEEAALSVAAAPGSVDLVWVEGPDAVAFVDGLLSQDVGALTPGQVARSFMLGPQGKLRHLLWVLRADDRLGLVTDRGRGAELAADLAHYRIRVKAEIVLETRPISELWGPGSAETAGVGVEWIDTGDRVLVPIPVSGSERVVVVGSSVPAPGVMTETEMVAARVESGEPVMGRDVDETTIPQETGLVGQAVSFTKGCYLGQELVARIDSRGHVNRRLVGLAVDADGPVPPEGAVAWWDGREVGAITSVATSNRSGVTVGLGLIRREVAIGAPVELRWERGSTSATVRALPHTG